jgi:hypothetical protein
MTLFIDAFWAFFALAAGAAIQRACTRAQRKPDGQSAKAKAKPVANRQPAREAEQRRAQEHARLAAEEEQRRAEERAAREAEQRRAQEQARLAAEEEQRRAEERAAREAEQRRAQEQARLAAEEEQRRAEERAAREAEQRHAEEPAGDDEGSRIPEEELGSPPDEELTEPSGRDTPTEETDSEAAGEIPSDSRAPRQYRKTQATLGGNKRSLRDSPERETRDRATPIDVRLVFEKAGFCRVSLLPRRALGMPAELTVTGSGNPSELLALQDDWYQDVVLPDLGTFLRQGIEWSAQFSEVRTRLALSGRELYVLGRHSRLNGFVNIPRLIIGEENVVLCCSNRLSEVSSAITLTDSPTPTLLTPEKGIPAGWIGLRGVIPRTPLAPHPERGVFDALRPRAEAWFALEGGIRIERHTWLAGFPPIIRIHGDTSTLKAVIIDGHEATQHPDGTFTSPGWDLPGEHYVSCDSNSRTYTIRTGAEHWEPWAAYRWSLGEHSVDLSNSGPAICGALLLIAGGPHSRPAIVLPSSNPILIGSHPGEIASCVRRNDVRLDVCIGLPSFEPVWALPNDPLHCDKREARVMSINSLSPATHMKSFANLPDRGSRVQRIQAWCQAILAAGRRGLATDPSDPQVVARWRVYRQYAKALQRTKR